MTNNNNSNKGFIYILFAIFFLFILFGLLGVFTFNRRVYQEQPLAVNENFDNQMNSLQNERFFHTNNIGVEVATDPIHVQQNTLRTALLEQHDLCADKKKSL
jgi:hypothetical protein